MECALVLRERRDGAGAFKANGKYKALALTSGDMALPARDDQEYFLKNNFFSISQKQENDRFRRCHPFWVEM
jgi:hypothetical protein